MNTYTSRNVIRYQNELELQVYDTVENVSGICFFFAVLFPNVPELGVEREDTKISCSSAVMARSQVQSCAASR